MNKTNIAQRLIAPAEQPSKQTSKKGASPAIDYRDESHEALPHVVKFSGGRSSGMMLFKLLKERALKRERGDVVIFNNTSAEHPKTYEFVAQCKQACETTYGVPFFIVEHCTYEDSYQGDYIRMSTFRLANAEPYSKKNPNGYRWQGEIFEELLSWNGVLPSIFQRTCTVTLKLQTTKLFLKEWLLNRPATRRKGHFADKTRIDLDALYRRHIKNRGSVPKKIFLNKKRFVLEQPHFRDEQLWSDYSDSYSPFANSKIEGRIFGDHVKFGADFVEYVGIVGLRSDEKLRVQKIFLKSGITETDDDYAGEQVYAPLCDLGVTSEDVITYWNNQSWNLELDPKQPISNCTFCFLKGVENLRLIKSFFDEAKDKTHLNTPCDINWWARVEEEYAKDFSAEGKTTRTEIPDNLIGFFGARSGYLYKSLASEKQDPDMEIDYPSGFVPCECTE